MSATLHFPDVGPDASSGDDRRPGSLDIGWAERAFASEDRTEKGRLRSAEQRTPRPHPRRVALVLCALVLIFAGVVISAANLSPATAPVPSHHGVSTSRQATTATGPTRIHLGPPSLARAHPHESIPVDSAGFTAARGTGSDRNRHESLANRTALALDAQ
jgi:hypothetical protein